MKYSFAFTNETDDYYQFCKFTRRNNPIYKRNSLIIRIIILLFIFASAFLVLMGRLLLLGAAPYLYGAVILCVGLFYNQINDLYLYVHIKASLRKGRLHYDKEVALEFFDDGYHEKTPESESSCKYSIIERIRVGRKAIYLYYALNSAHIIPLRVFENEAQREDFLQFIQNKVSAS